ncbi:GDP-fucose protein O-fucosyltransferase 2 [Patella vulgata]|uniref:GDP-fucose protein O-fucosyltransferase 2 n=1 Tax=Patella vulgata TaxID=6465 RepID=UPI0024A923D2|nr:GDP-fucose protein O-fucosyltransferase 2 [Patella vulgata]
MTTVRHLSGYLFLSALFIIDAYCGVNEDTAFDAGNGVSMTFAEAKAPRFLLYNVNYGEGFNLRRDVYMRIANLVRVLNEEEPWILVLPPWGRLYHWQSKDIKNQNRIRWSLFFDVYSLKKFAPVVEFEEFLTMSKEPVIDEVYYLQNYKEGWTEWEEKMDFRPCNENNHYYWKNFETGKWDSWFFGYEDQVTASKFQCVSFMGHASFLKPFLLKNTTARSVMIERAETVLHDQFGNSEYWQARRSMVFSTTLRDIGNEFRAKYLDSTDEKDNTIFEEDWTKMKRKHGEAKGGQYIGVHLRRKDFLRTSRHLPSLKHAAKQIEKLLIKYNLSKVFIATDAPRDEFEELSEYLSDFEVLAFNPTSEVREEYKEGGLAIIDQWICAHARYFIGTEESTFSFRIQEEREILGFDPEMTFNRLCDDKEKFDCEKSSKWTITY